MTGPEDRDAPDDAAMRDRLSALSRDLSRNGQADGGQPPAEASPAGMGEAINLGIRVMSEFVAAVAVGGVIGWQLDRWFHTSPGGLILFIGLGTAAGFWNVYRVATKTGPK